MTRRGLCPVCHCRWPVRKNGTMGTHIDRLPRKGTAVTLSKGSGRPAVEEKQS